MAAAHREAPGDHEAPGLVLPGDLADLVGGFTGRGWVLDRVDGFLDSAEPSFLLVGGPGTGKSLLAARLVELSAGRVAAGTRSHLGPGSVFHAHFCRANDPDRIRPGRLVEELSSHLGSAFAPCREAILEAARRGGRSVTVQVGAGQVEAGATVTGIGTLNVTVGEGVDPTETFSDLVTAPLRALAVAEPDVSVVVVVDALDEALAYDPDRESRTIPGLVGTVLGAPESLPPNLRFLLTSRPERRVLRALGREPDLDLIADAPEGVDDIEDYVRARLATGPLQAQPEALARRVAEAAQGVFLYAYHVVTDLEADPGRVEDPDALDLPQGLEGVYRGFLHRELAQNTAAWEDDYRPVLGVLAVARGEGLTRGQLAGAVGVRPDGVARPLRVSAQYLAGPDPDGPYRIWHHSFREFLLDDPDYRVDPGEAHRALAEFLLGSWEGDWVSCDDPYALAWTPTHLAAALEAATRPERRTLAPRLAALLTDLGFLEAKTAQVGIDPVLADISEAAPLIGGDHPAVTGVHRVLDREAHHLRGRHPEELPAFFAQQVRNKAAQLEFADLARAAEQRLGALGRPWVRLTWEVGGASPALERTLAGHQDLVSAVALTPDGRRAVSGSGDRTLRVWDLATGEELATLTGHQREITAVAVTADGQRAVSASEDKTLRVWDLATGKELATLTGHRYGVTAVAVTPDGRWAVSGSYDRTLRIWDLATGKELATLAGHQDGVTAVAVTPEGHRAVSASYDRTLRIWDLATGKELATLAGHQDGVTAVAVTPDGRRAVSASDDKTLRVWDLATAEQLATLSGHQDRVTAVALTPDGSRAVSASYDETLRMWDLATWKELATLAGHRYRVTAVAVTPDGRRAVSGSRDETLQVWDLAAGEEAATLAGHQGGVSAVAVTPDGRRAVSGSADETLRVWDLDTGEQLATLAGHQGGVSAVAVTPDGRRAVSGSADETLRVWDLDTGEQLATLTGHQGWVTALVLTPDGRRAVSASWDRTLRVWDLATGEQLATLAGHQDLVWAVAVTPDGRRAVSASADEALRVWDLDTGEQLATLTGHQDGVTALVLTPDGRRAVSASWDGTLRVWDLDTGEEIATLAGHHGPVEAVAVTPDERRAVSGSRDETIRIWDLDTREELATLTGHEGSVSAVALTPDGRRAVSASDDQTLRVWDLDTGDAISVLALDGAVTCLAITPDSQSALAGGSPRNLWCLLLVDP